MSIAHERGDRNGVSLREPVLAPRAGPREPAVTSTSAVAALRVVRWRPLAIATAVGTLYAVLGSNVTAADRLMAAAAAVAATSAFVIDDPAAVTVASTPLTLLRRRAGRVLIVMVTVVVWWAVVVTITGARFGPMPIRAISVALLGLVAAALSVAAVVAGSGLAERDGLAGATASAIAYGLSLLPLPAWSLWPRSPGSPGTATRWLVFTGIAVAVFVWSCRDPAAAPLSSPARGRAGCWLRPVRSENAR